MMPKVKQGYNDMHGEIRSSISGGTLWTTEAITDTTFIVGALKSDVTSDFMQVTVQIPHSKQRNAVCADFHIHYILQAASTLNQTITFTGSYCWIQPTDTIPADASWTAFSGAGLTLDLGAVKPVRYYSIHQIQTNIPCPAAPNETYGGMLLIKLFRTNAGTYTSNLGILDADCHAYMIQMGSTNAASD